MSFKIQKRAGIGVRALRFRKTVAGDKIAGSIISAIDNELMIVSEKGTLCRQSIAKISKQKRTSQGVRIVTLSAKDKVTSIAKVIPDEIKDPSEN